MKEKIKNVKKKLCAAGVFAAAAGITVPSVVGTLQAETVFAEINEVEINAANFPDENFRSYVASNFDSDSSGALDELEIANVTSIDTGWNRQINSLEGIERFAALTSLSCHHNNLSGLNISSNKALTYLDCSYNSIKNLDVSNNTALTYLGCSVNNLDELNLGKNTSLINLYASSNNLENLDVTDNTALERLECSGNKLKDSLNVSNNIALTYLNCADNNLNSLYVNNNAKLTELKCSNNNLNSLDISNDTALEILSCSDNNIENLDISNNLSLTSLGCDRNKINSLNTTKNSALKYLHCKSNKINSLDLKENTALQNLHCDINNIKSLDLSKHTELYSLSCSDNKMTSLDIRNTKISAVGSGIISGNNLTKDTFKFNSGTKVWVSEIKLNKTKANLGIGNTMKLTATVTPSFANDKAVTWSSSDTKIATVDKNGNVKGIKAGTAKIMARVTSSPFANNGAGYECAYAEITVKPVSVTGVKLNKTNETLTQGSSLKLTATVSPSDATEKGVTWNSSNTGVATVDANGNVKAINHGTAKITAKTVNGKTATCEVRVNFIDVTDTKSWYYKAVYWAADKGITTGSNGKFTPAGDCTREQAITFLWRMAGKPNPKSMTSKFSDVKDKNRYSYKAIMWGSEKGIITGTNGKFNPTGTCTREQIVTMIWRLAGSPNPKTTTSKFKDVTNKKLYSYKAILWANEKGIATGSNGKFSPTEKCKRRDIVTFIYRYKN